MTISASEKISNTTPVKKVAIALKEDPSVLAAVENTLLLDSYSKRMQIEQHLIVLRDSKTSPKDRLANAEILAKVVKAVGICSGEGDMIIEIISAESLDNQQQSIREGVVLLAKALLKSVGRM